MKNKNKIQLIKRLFSLLLSPFGNGVIFGAIYSLLLLAKEKLSSYFVYKEFPLSSDFVNFSIPVNIINEKVGIVIQGPVVVDDGFTLETVKLYNRIFPGTVIIVSTWNDIDDHICEKLQEAGAIIVLNQKPKHTGVYNVNMQAASSLSGLKKAKELGCDYCIKTRSDQRIYRTLLLPFLFSLLKKFPIEGDAVSGQEGRIVFCEGNHPANLIIPYHICDFFFFGRTSDLISYFDYDLSSEDWSTTYLECWDKSIADNITGEEFHNKYAPEVLLMKNYLKRHNTQLDSNDPVQCCWDIVSTSFLAISMEDLSLYWFKNGMNSNYSAFYNDFRRDVEKLSVYYNCTWSFRNWLAIHMGMFDQTNELKSICKQQLSESKLG